MVLFVKSIRTYKSILQRIEKVEHKSISRPMGHEESSEGSKPDRASG